jgi:drug/metabolite transporter (DMT)-like permease
MVFIFLSVFLLGLTHPVGSLVIKDYSDPIGFALLYLSIRTISQLFLMRKEWFKEICKKDTLKQLIFVGIGGGLLNYFQFKALASGIPLANIIFITYTFPILVMIYNRFIGDTKSEEYRLFIAITGLGVIFGDRLGGLELNINYIYPLFCSALIAFWVIMSKRLTDKGLNPIAFSFGNDFFSTLTIVMLFFVLPGKMQELPVVYQGANLKVILYSICIGVIPNILFYKGLKTSSPITAAIAMLLQPVLSILISTAITGEKITPMSICGLLLIMVSNAPARAFSIDDHKGGSLLGFILRKLLPLKS